MAIDTTQVMPFLKQIDSGVQRTLSRVDGLEQDVRALQDDNRKRKLGLGISLPGVNEGKDQFSLAKAVVAIGMKHLGQDVWKDIKGEYELEVLTQATRKAMDSGTGGAGGGFVVPQQALADFIERLYANTTVIKAGARVYPNLSGSPVLIPKQLTSANIYWIAENPPAGITKSVVTHGNLIMTPKTMAARAQYSNLLALLSNHQLALRTWRRSAHSPLGLTGAISIGRQPWTWKACLKTRTPCRRMENSPM